LLLAMPRVLQCRTLWREGPRPGSGSAVLRSRRAAVRSTTTAAGGGAVSRRGSRCPANASSSVLGAVPATGRRR